MPVEMIGSEVQEGRGMASQRRGRLELEAREFEHPGPGQRVRIERFAQGIEGARRDVAGDAHRPAGTLDHRAQHAHRRRLAIGAGDAQHARRVAAVAREVGECAREELDLAGDLAPRGPRGRERRRDVGAQGGEAGARSEQGGARRVGIDGPAREAGRGQLARERGAHGRVLPRVGDLDIPAATREPAGHGEAAFSESEDAGAHG